MTVTDWHVRENAHEGAPGNPTKAGCGRHDLRARLEESILFDGYPEVVSAGSKAEKTRILHELTSSYLLKDVPALENIRNSQTIF